jgi:hypothetical protein
MVSTIASGAALRSLLAPPTFSSTLYVCVMVSYFLFVFWTRPSLSASHFFRRYWILRQEVSPLFLQVSNTIYVPRDDCFLYIDNLGDIHGPSMQYRCLQRASRRVRSISSCGQVLNTLTFTSTLLPLILASKVAPVITLLTMMDVHPCGSYWNAEGSENMNSSLSHYFMSFISYREICIMFISVHDDCKL